MTDTATSRYGARQQSQGANTNTWGDDKLNEVLRLFDRGSKGYQALAMTGDTTLSWSNYVATNTGQCAVLVLTGSLSAAASLIVPSVEWQWSLVKNTTGQTVTVKTASGTGAAIPTGRQVAVYCDGADCYFAAANYLGAETTEANNRDLMDKAAVETAIASASLPATSGTVLVSVTDTAAGYLAAKHTVQVGTITTTQLGGLTSISWSTIHVGGVEQLQINYGAGYVGGFLNGGLQAARFIPAQGSGYDVDCTTALVTVNLSGMTSVELGQEIKLNKFGNNPMLLLGTVNGATNLVVPTTSNETYRYCGGIWGWN